MARKKAKALPFEERTIVGLTENIKIQNNGRSEVVVARIDSGATKSSIDIGLSSNLQLGPVVATKLVKSANGARLRPMVEVNVTLGDRKVKGRFTLADRSHMKYKVLIGQNILRQGFLIDPNKE